MPSLIPARVIRMPDTLYLKLKSIAKKERRSYNQQTVLVLEKFVRDYEAEHGVIEVNTDELYE